MSISKDFTFIDLFAGIGGFRSGMSLAGAHHLFANERDKYAAETYKAWYGEKNLNTEDINSLSLKDKIPRHDILCAGFPCQPFSIAGVSKKNSLGRDHGFKDRDQGNLFFKIMDIVDKLDPPILFLENVKNLKSHDKGQTWNSIEHHIKKRNYAVFTKIIDASCFVPQHRERIFIVCFKKSFFTKRAIDIFKFPSVDVTRKPILADILLPRPDKKYMLSDKLWEYLQYHAQTQRQKGNGFGYGLNSREDVSRTMSARYYKDGAEILIKESNWRNPRRLLPLEAMSLMGFEKRYSEFFGHKEGFPQVVSDAQAYKQFGNSVVPKIVEVIGGEILKVLNNNV